MDFLQLSGKRFLIFGVANKKSVAYAVSKLLKEEGAECVFVVQNDAISERVKKLFPDSEIFTCDVEKEEDIKNLRTKSARSMNLLTECYIPLRLRIIPTE